MDILRAHMETTGCIVYNYTMVARYFLMRMLTTKYKVT